MAAHATHPRPEPARRHSPAGGGARRPWHRAVCTVRAKRTGAGCGENAREENNSPEKRWEKRPSSTGTRLLAPLRRLRAQAVRRRYPSFHAGACRTCLLGRTRTPRLRPATRKQQPDAPAQPRPPVRPADEPAYERERRCAARHEPGTRRRTRRRTHRRAPGAAERPCRAACHWQDSLLAAATRPGVGCAHGK